MTKEKDSIHECGHALIAKLFEDELEVISLTLNPKIYSNSTNTQGWSGGIHVRPRKKYLINPTLESKDKLIISLWGGLVAQNIFIKGSDDIQKNIEKYLINSESLDTSGIGGDWEFIEKYTREQISVRNLSYTEYKSESLRFAFTYLLDDKVWETLESLSELLMNNTTLLQNEIEQHYKDTGFIKHLYRVKTSILLKRYPVSFYDKVFYMIRSF